MHNCTYPYKDNVQIKTSRDGEKFVKNLLKSYIYLRNVYKIQLILSLRFTHQYELGQSIAICNLKSKELIILIAQLATMESY